MAADVSPAPGLALRYAYVVREAGEEFVCHVVEWPALEGRGKTQEEALGEARKRVVCACEAALEMHELVPDPWVPETTPVESLRETIERLRGDILMIDALAAAVEGRSRLVGVIRAIARSAISGDGAVGKWPRG